MESTRKRKTLEMFRGVLKGKRWPANYWKDDLGRKRARICIEYMILKEYGDEYSNHIEYRATKSLFTKYKLSNMLSTVYSGDAKLAIIDGLSESNPYYKKQLDLHNDICLVESKRNSLGFDDMSLKNLIKNTILNSLGDKFEASSIRSVIYRYKLEKDFENMYNSKITLLVEDLFPNKFKDWEVAVADGISLDSSYWGIKSNRKDAYEWLMSDVNNFSNKTPRELGMVGLLEYYVDNYTDMGSSCNSFAFAMHNEFNPGNIIPLDVKEDGYKDYWQNNRDIAKSCTRWLLNELNLNYDNITTITYSDFMDNHLGIMLTSVYNGDVFLAINDILPNKFSRWAFKEHPSYLWDDRETRIDALKWVFNNENIDIDNLINQDHTEISNIINEDLFNKYNLNYLFKVYYKRNILDIIKDISPNKDFSEDLNELSCIDYKKLFGEYEELTLCENNNGEIVVDSEELSKIFKGNPNFWGAYQPNFSHKVWSSERKETSVLKDILNDKIKIYKYSIDEVDEPKTYEESKKRSYLVRHSKAKSYNTAWLYWRAYKFFKKANLYLDCYDTIMGLNSNDRVGTCFSSTNNDEIDIPYSRVRCGELSFEKLYMLLNSGVQYIWAFTFDDEDFFSQREDNKVDIYLIESICDYKESHKREMIKTHRRIQKRMKMFNYEEI